VLQSLPRIGSESLCKQRTGTERVLTKATGKVAKRLTAYSAKSMAPSAKAQGNWGVTEYESFPAACFLSLASWQAGVLHLP
jgi:hypothetical protein